MRFKRIFLLILDSVGVGEAEDAINYGDVGCNTLGHIKEKTELFIPNLAKIGFLDTLNMNENKETDAYYTIAKPNNVGKDTLNGHYEILGISNKIEFKVFNEGFPDLLLSQIEQITGRRVIGNIYGNGENIINELGDREVNYGSLIVYTSSDSDIQVAAHEDVIPISTLYSYCSKIRQLTLMNEEWRVGRVVARPFSGTNGNYKFINSARKDYAVKPPKKTILDALNDKKYNVIGFGKINDIFDSNGINKTIKASDNIETINKLTDIMDKNFTGLCMVNLADFDTLFGHRRDVEGYANALEELDVEIPMILNKLEIDDLLIITADHGNDPTFDGADHTRENVPVIFFSRGFTEPKRLPILNSFADIGATIADNFDIEAPEIGESVLDQLI